MCSEAIIVTLSLIYQFLSNEPILLHDRFKLKAYKIYETHFLTVDEYNYCNSYTNKNEYYNLDGICDINNAFITNDINILKDSIIRISAGDKIIESFSNNLFLRKDIIGNYEYYSYKEFAIGYYKEELVFIEKGYNSSKIKPDNFTEPLYIITFIDGDYTINEYIMKHVFNNKLEDFTFEVKYKDMNISTLGLFCNSIKKAHELINHHRNNELIKNTKIIKYV